MENQHTVSTDNPYGLAALWATGDIIARAVLVILLIMSLASWYVMLTKLWDQRKLK
ncbi:MAG: MotA/TolQ/ExbB proton channel family protein, partial [Gammaproteobacteria bacterium]